MSVSVRPATEADLAAIELLLSGSNLTTAGVTDQLGRFLAAEDDGRVIACAGMEVYGSSALLRSVAVRSDYRNRGLARTLVAKLLARARQEGVAQLYLLTSTAAAYFQKFGFTPVDRDEIEKAVLASKEFEDEGCATAQAMALRIHHSNGRGAGR